MFVNIQIYNGHCQFLKNPKFNKGCMIHHQETISPREALIYKRIGNATRFREKYLENIPAEMWKNYASVSIEYLLKEKSYCLSEMQKLELKRIFEK